MEAETHPLLRFPQRQLVSRLGVSRTRRQPGGPKERMVVFRLPCSLRRSRRSIRSAWSGGALVRSSGLGPRLASHPRGVVSQTRRFPGSHRSRQETDPPGLTFAPHTLLTLAAARGSGQDQPLRLISSTQHTLQRAESQEASKDG